jgi:hypothetical protein
MNGNDAQTPALTQSGPWWWPVYDEEDPHVRTLMSAHAETLQLRDIYATHSEPTPPGTKIAVITCFSAQERKRSTTVIHPPDRIPPLGELWSTSCGLMFKSRLIGAQGDPPDWFFANQGQPFATMEKQLREWILDNMVEPWTDPGIAITDAIVLIDRQPCPDLWVKCPDHGSFRIDPISLISVAREAHDRRVDDTHSVAIRLDEVIAVD